MQSCDGGAVAITSRRISCSLSSRVIDFRDQDDGAQIAMPIVAHTETKVLTTSWAEYTMMATAPASPPNPVYASRLHFEARSGDTVDVDRVQAVPEPTQLVSLALGSVLLRLLKRRRESAARP